MGSPARHWKQSVRNLLGARKEKPRKDCKRSSSVAAGSKPWRAKQTDGGRQSWRSSSLRTHDAELGFRRSSPMASSATAAKPRGGKQTESGSSSGRKSWRSSSLRAYDVDLAVGAALPLEGNSEWRSQSFRNVSSPAWTVSQDEMRRSTSANSFSPRHGEDDPSYLAFEKLFDQFQGKHLDTRKVLVTVNVLGTVGRLRLFVEDIVTVRQLIAMTLNEYALERRLPPLDGNVEAYVLYLTPFDPHPVPPQETIRQLRRRSFVLGRAKQVTPSSHCKTPIQETHKGSRSWWRSATTGISHISSALRFHEKKVSNKHTKSTF